MKRILCVMLVVLSVLFVGCSTKGELIKEEDVAVRVLIKSRGKKLMVQDMKTGIKFDMSVSDTIYASVDVDNVVKAKKKTYVKDNKTKYYYSIVTKNYNDANLFEMGKAQLKGESDIVLTVIKKYVIHTSIKGITSTSCNLTLRPKGLPYSVKKTVSSSVYDSCVEGQKILGKKKDYILEDGREVSKFEIVTK